MTTATELLTRALDKWDAETASWSDLFEEIRTFLAAEPEAEPVAWMHVYKTHKEPNLFPLLTHECEAKGLTQYPLYTRPSPARKPLSDVEIADIYYRGMCFEKGYLSAFAEGFRKAEKHHEIGGDDE
jgi:hypothetical protein